MEKQWAGWTESESVVNDFMFRWQLVMNGFSQGSVFCTMFLISSLISDIDHGNECTPSQFAEA